MPIPELRPYQKSNLAEIRELWRTHQSVLYQSQTGSGKGTVASWLTHKATLDGRRVLFIVDRRALVIDFSENRLTKQFGLPHGVIMGSHPSRPWERTHVASIDTLCRRLDRLPKADIILVDECRFSSSPKWTAVLSRYPATTKILGFDATPQAPGGKGLGRASGGIFDAIVHGPSTKQLISDGYLLPGRIFTPSKRDRSGLRRRGDEFTEASMAACVTKTSIGDTVAEYRKICPDRKAFYFGVHQKHAFDAAEKFRCAGVNFAYMDANTPEDTRRSIWRDYDYGDLRGVANVAVISYGADHPICSCVIIDRPVGSEPLYRQMLGRPARPYRDQKDFFALDHWGNCETENLNVAFDDDVEWSLDGGNTREQRDSVSMSMCIHCRGNFRTGPRACPYCGVEIQKKIKEAESVEGELEEFVRRPMTAAEWQAKVQGEARYKQLRELYEVQTQRGYKKGYATMAFKSMFGYFPPKDWMKLVIGEDATQMEI